jgi:hypothetical protein
MAYTGTQTITEKIADNPSLVIDHLNRTLRAVRNTEAAAGAFIFVYVNYLSYHVLISPQNNLFSVHSVIIMIFFSRKNFDPGQE